MTDMKAAILNRYGGIEHVALQDVDVPEIGPNEVLVRVTSASVNPLDLKLIHGYLKDFFPIPIPYPLGTDLFGTVVKAGSLVANWKPSDQVIGRLEPVPGPGRALKSRGGAFAEYVAMPVHQLASAPKGAKEGAGLPTAAGTAWQALFEIGGVEEGWEILIHAGAGGVGSFAIQLAKRAGARIMATASAGRLDLLARLGADEPVDYKETNFSRLAGKFDFVLDTIGGDTHAISFPLLRPGGKLVSIVHPPMSSSPNSTRSRHIGLPTPSMAHVLRLYRNYVLTVQFRFKSIVSFP